MLVRLSHLTLLDLRGRLPLLLEDRVQLGRLLRPTAPELEARVFDMLVDDDLSFLFK